MSNWLAGMPESWGPIPVKSMFTERRVTAPADAVHLTPSQTYGVLPQADYMERTGSRVVQVLEGGDNMKAVEPDDFVIHLRSFQGGIERSTFRGKVSPAYTVLTPKPGLEPRFYRWVLKSQGYIQELQSTTNQLRDGQSIKFKDFASIPLPFPALEEQRAIADYLDRETAQIDRLIDLQMRLIQKLKDRSVVKIRELVTGRANPGSQLKDSGISWLGCIDSLYRLIRVRHLAKVGTGFGDTVDAVENGIYPFYVRSQTPLTSNDFDFSGPAVLTAGDGAGVAKVFHLVADGKFKAHQRVYVLHSFEGISPAFFFHFFKVYFSEIALDGSAKSTVDSVRRHMITDMSIVVPSLEDQQRVVKQIETEEASALAIIRDAEQLVTLSLERRAALITAAVTGQIDVSQGRAA